MSAFISIHGRLGRDPVERTAQKSGKIWCSASLVTQTGEEPPLWFDLVAFGKVAEALAKHAKGEPVAVSGRLQLNVWADAEEKKHERLQVVADAIVSARTARPAGKRKERAADRHDASAEPKANQSERDLNDEIPF